MTNRTSILKAALRKEKKLFIVEYNGNYTARALHINVMQGILSGRTLL